MLDLLRSSDRLMTFKEILESMVDKDDDYLRFKDEGRKSTLNCLDLGLVLAGQPISILADLTTEFEGATRHAEMEVEPNKAAGQVGTTTGVKVQTSAG